MPITSMAIAAVAPRGGPIGTSITITGSGFGGPLGTVRFAPTNLNLLATVSSWSDTQVVCVVPAGLPANTFSDVQVINSTGTDYALAPFWLPATSPPQDNDGLKHQWPAFEAGPNQAADDPRVFTAADFNRVLDRVNAALAGGGGGGTGAPPKAEAFATVNGQTFFVLSTSPVDTLRVFLVINGAWYWSLSGDIIVGGVGNRTVTLSPALLALFSITTTDAVWAIYWEA